MAGGTAKKNVSFPRIAREAVRGDLEQEQLRAFHRGDSPISGIVKRFMAAAALHRTR
jgi:hypothetical protein